MKRNRKAIVTKILLLTLLAVVLLGLPLFGDRKRDPENYLTSNRKEQLEAFVELLLDANVEVAALQHKKQDLVISGASSLTAELEQKISNFMDSEGWELLKVERRPKPTVTFGSYSGRTWAIYAYSAQGAPSSPRCSPRLLAGNWYYCEY